MTEAVTSDTTGPAFVTVSTQAATRLKDEIARRGAAPKALRLMVFPGGCAGLTYAMSFAEGPPEAYETVCESEGVRVYVDSRYAEMLQGASIGWVDNLIGGGFKVTNPNATHACGCGKSFS